MIVYTVRGGSAAVIWTDVVQLFVYVAGAAVVFLSLLALIPGGWAEVVRVGSAAGKFRVFDLSWTLARPYTLWAGIIGGVALTLSTHGTDQFLVQRLLSARSAREAARGLVLSGFLVFAQFMLFLVIGIMLFTYYQHVPLPRVLARSDEILPRFIVTALSHGAAGFIVAAIVAAALSPSINSMAATTVNDFYAKYIRPDADESTLMRVSRRWTIVWGVVQIGVAIAAQWMQRSVLDAGLAVLSWASGPVLGAFLLGTLAPAITEGQALVGHDGRARRDDDRLGMAAADCVHLVRVHRRRDDGERGVDCAARSGPAEAGQDGLLIQQILRPHQPPLRLARCPRCGDRLEDRRPHECARARLSIRTDAGPLRDRTSCRTICAASPRFPRRGGPAGAQSIGHDHEDTLAFLTCVLAGGWREPHRIEADTGNATRIQRLGELHAINPWSADLLEGRVGAATDRKVRALDCADAGIQRRLGAGCACSVTD